MKREIPYHVLVKAYFFLIISILYSPLTAQEIPEKWIEELVEEICLSDEELAEYPDLAGELCWLSQHPVNLNHTTRGELSRIPFLTPFQVEMLAEYAEKSGPVKSIYEIAYLTGFDAQLAGWLTPFIEFGPYAPERKGLKALASSARHSFLIRYQETPGLRAAYLSLQTDSTGLESVPLGNPARIMMRYDLSAGKNIRLGWSGEKDPGEAWLSGGSGAIPDHFSFYLEAEPAMGMVSRFNAGDFHLSMGQGLVAWTSYVPGKSVTAWGSRKIPAGIRAYHSTGENRFFRGAAVSMEKGAFGMVWMVSGTHRDARLYEGKFESFIEGGIHATSSQLETRKTVRELATGGMLRYGKRNLRLGVNMLGVHWDPGRNPATLPYEMFEISGKGYVLLSADYQIGSQRLLLYGESATDLRGSTAHLHGAEWSPADKFRMSVVYRNYSPGYPDFLSGSFSEAAGTANERGIFAGLTWEPIPGWKLGAWHDSFRFPWLSYRMDSPGRGEEFSLQAERSWKEETSLLFSIRSETRDYNLTTGESAMAYASPRKTGKIKVRLSSRPLDPVTLNTHLYISRCKKEGSPDTGGYLLGQDLGIHPGNQGKYIWFRMALFHTEDYDTRIFNYEHDVWGSLSFPSFSGKGTRYYILLKTPLWKGADAWIRWALTRYTDRESTGSSFNTLDRPVRQEIKFQLRQNF